MHFWMNWDILFFFKILKHSGGEHAIRRLKIAWPVTCYLLLALCCLILTLFIYNLILLAKTCFLSHIVVHPVIFHFRKTPKCGHNSGQKKCPIQLANPICFYWQILVIGPTNPLCSHRQFQCYKDLSSGLQGFAIRLNTICQGFANRSSEYLPAGLDICFPESRPILWVSSKGKMEVRGNINNPQP